MRPSEIVGLALAACAAVPAAAQSAEQPLVKGSAEPSFETAACASAMRHSRFEPALDAQGQPVASYWGITIIYQTGR